MTTPEPNNSFKKSKNAAIPTRTGPLKISLNATFFDPVAGKYLGALF
jgi:hypothetical protein